MNTTPDSSPVQQGVAEATSESPQLARGLSLRHIMFIALGSAIGTGLFYGSASAIQLAGPSVLLAYVIGGAAVFMVMRAMGELALAHPVSGAFSEYATRYLGRWAGFVTGWTYALEMALVAIADVTAFAVYMKFWFPNSPSWIWIVSVLLILLAINLAKVKAFGETEFWFTLVKVSAIVAMIVGGIALLFVGVQAHDSVAPSVTNLWALEGGFFANGFTGFLACFTVVMFAFGGIENIGIAAGEAKDPRTSIPKAIRTVPFRILIFYILTLSVIMSLYPWYSVTKANSPFVQIFEGLGIPAADSILNMVIITAAISALNADVYGAGRMMYGLAKQNLAPRILREGYEERCALDDHPHHGAGYGGRRDCERALRERLRGGRLPGNLRDRIRVGHDSAGAHRVQAQRRRYRGAAGTPAPVAELPGVGVHDLYRGALRVLRRHPAGAGDGRTLVPVPAGLLPPRGGARSH